MTTTYDLMDLDLFARGEMFAAWRHLRAEDPVHLHRGEDGGFWSLVRYDDIVGVYRDPSTFSSAKGTVMGGSYRDRTDSATGHMLICTDLPYHRTLRRQVRPGFSSAVVERIVTLLRPLLERTLDEFVADGGGDFAEQVAPVLPASVLMAMLGVDLRDAHHLLGLTRAMIGYRDDEYRSGASVALELVQTQAETFAFLADLVERRRADPGDDLVSMLLAGDEDGRLTYEEVLYNGLNVAVGGNETTPHTASAMVVAFVEHPDQVDRLYGDPALLPTALEEILRWTSTNAYVQRTATRDVEIRGRRIEAGQAVTLWNASANRDEDVFERSEEFDLARTPNRHIAFGTGHHHCIGATVARRELRLLLEECVRRGLRFELAGPIERLRSNFMLGIKHLPVTVAAA